MLTTIAILEEMEAMWSASHPGSGFRMPGQSLQSSAHSPKVAGGPEDNTAVGNGHPRGNGDRQGQRAPERAGGQVGDLQFDVVRKD